MRLQEVGDPLGHLRSDDLADLLHGRLTDLAHRAETANEVALALLADPLDLVENRKDNLPLPELLVIGVREPVGLVSNPLQQLQRMRISGQRDRLRIGDSDDQLFALR